MSDSVFTMQDWRDLRVTASITKQVASTHFGLGSLTALTKCFDIANMGVVIVGRGGMGKTATLHALEQISHKAVFTKEFTQAGVTEEINAMFTNGSITWICYDLSKMTTFFSENMFRVVCALLTDHAAQVRCTLYDLDITNAYISWIGASTYQIYAQLITSALWDGTYRERICRIYQFPYRRKMVTKNPPKVMINSRSFEDVDSVHCDEKYSQAASALLSHQFSHERTSVYAPDLLRASASLNHRKFVTEADLKFLKLFEFSFQVEHRLGRRLGLSSPIYLDAEAVALMALALEYTGITPERIFAIHRTETQYTINAFIRGRDVFFTTSPRDTPEDQIRIYVRPELLSMINRQYDFEELASRLTVV